MKNYQINGRLVAANTSDFPKLIIEAWDKDVKNNDLLDRAVCDAAGNFSLSFNTLDFKDHPIDYQPDVFFRVYHRRQLIHSTEQTPIKNLATRQLDGVSLEVDPSLWASATNTDTIAVKEWGLLSGLSAEAATKLDIAWNNEAANLNPNTIKTLIDQEVITAKQGDRLTMIQVLDRASSSDIDLIRQVQSYKFAKLGNKKAEKLDDLVRLSYSDIKTALDKTPNLDANTGAATATVAHKVLLELENRYPTQRLFQQVLPQKEHQEQLIAAVIETPKRTGNVLTNTYRHLGIGEIAAAKDYSNTEKVTLIQERLQSFSNFFELNPELNIRTANFGTKHLDSYSFGTDDPQVKQGIFKTLQGFQRSLYLAPNTSVATQLLQAGFDSSQEILEVGFNRFQTQSQLAPSIAVEVYAVAQQRHEEIAYQLVSLSNFAWDLPLAYLDNSPEPGELLKELDDYADFFGNQSFCNCNHCSSIFSPAAYFVDLMDFVEQHINKEFFTGKEADHFLHLKNRRPDLWKIPLSCENTNKLIPYLTIINEVLEAYLRKRKNWNTNSQLYKNLSSAVYSFRQPFNLPLTQLNTYLSYFKRSLSEVVQLLHPNSTAAEYALLGLSADEAALVTEPNLGVVFLKRLYGFDSNEAKVDVQVFLKVMGVDRKTFGKLLKTKFVKGNESPKVIAAKEPEDAIQFNIEYATQLSPSILDRLHRFTRLWQRLDWTVEELDFVATELGWNLNSFAKLIHLRQLLGEISLEDTMALLGSVSPALFNQTYNIPYFVSAEDKLPDSQQILLHPALQVNEAPSINNPMVHRLLAALEIDDATFVQLIKQLAPSLGIQENNPGFKLSKANLTLLLKEVRLMQQLGLSGSDYLTLKELAGVQDLSPSGSAQLLILIEYHQVIKNSPLAIGDWKAILAQDTLAGIDPSHLRDRSFAILEEQQMKIDENSDLNALLEAILPEILGLDLAIVQELLILLEQPNNPANLLAAFSNNDEQGDFLYLIRQLLPWKILVETFKLDANSLAFIRQQPDLFHLVASNVYPSRLAYESLKHLSLYWKLNKKNEGTDEALQTVLPILGDSWDDILEALSDVTAKASSYLTIFLHAIDLPSNGIQALHYLYDVLEYSDLLGINGQSLSLLGQIDYDNLELAAQAIIAAFHAKHPKNQIDSIAEPIENKLREAQQAALSDYLIHAIHPEFNSSKDLYYYFLLDTELSGCARTSRVVAANASLQLYVQRVIMLLEQDRDEELLVELDAVAKAQWHWRKNYRVWEANRKVFLFPENYILPELRDQKSEPFRALEKELQQQTITHKSASTSFLRYLETTAKLGSLKIVGSYLHQQSPANQTLYLIGRPPASSDEWYYRTFDVRSRTFSIWHKIELNIQTNYVAPIVYLGTLYLFWYDIASKPVNRVQNGTSSFWGYEHRVAIRYSSVQTDGKWEKPVSIPFPKLFGGYGDREGLVKDPLLIDHTRFMSNHPNQPLDNYTLRGYKWDRPYMLVHNEQLYFTVFDGDDSDFYEVSILHQRLGKRSSNKGSSLYNVKYLRPYSGNVLLWKNIPNSSTGKYYYNAYKAASKEATHFEAQQMHSGDVIRNYERGWPKIHPINQWDSAFILEFQTYSYMALPYEDTNGYRNSASDYRLIPLNSTLPNQYKSTLFYEGIDELLSVTTQQEIEPYGEELNRGSYPPFYFLYYKIDNYSPEHPLGTYFNELFFHLPLLIANQLNSQQRFEAADQWYRYLFDPTAVDTRENVKQKMMFPYDRVWQYVGFLNQPIERLRQMLTNSEAIKTYEEDPFNPHAIARLRFNAYQKTIVMRYIDNLLDWGDQLFSLDTMESINEATLLYIMAADILGDRPAELGDCDSNQIGIPTYDTIESDSAFLKEFETVLLQYKAKIVGKLTWNGQLSSKKAHKYYKTKASKKKVPAKAINTSSRMRASAVEPIALANKNSILANYDTQEVYFANGYRPARHSNQTYQSLDLTVQFDTTNVTQATNQLPLAAITAVTKRYQAFCIPNNKQLLEYWDRVADRLHKIRNCMNISGVRRQLALFQPPIDPMLLVKAKAAGLNPQEVLALVSGGGQVLYRFPFLLEKAKQFAGKVQALGAALSAALERRDAEALIRIRSEQQQQLQQMATLSKEKRLEEIQQDAKSLAIQQEALLYKLEHYNQLLSNNGLSQLEQEADNYKLAANIVSGTEQATRVIGAVAYLLPNFGSPFAFTYGGKEVGDSANAWSDGFRSLAGILNTLSSVKATKASYARRKQGWKYQQKLLSFDEKSLNQQVIVNEIRQAVAERDLEMHQSSLTFLEDQYQFLSDKFGNEQLYTWMATELQSLHRQSYQLALQYAQMAEAAFRFERDEISNFYIQPSNWDQQKNGLLAGQRLSMQLEQMEMAYLQSSTRDMEVRQSFSLQLLDPKALLELQETGSCEIRLPEIAFDITYPGQYKRLLRNVSITVPCVTGPYINVNATLTLLNSQLRPNTSDPVIADYPPQKNNQIVLSSGEQDGGLLFSDLHQNKYLPFEGAGACSTWRLELPSLFRSFDYGTIADVIMTLSYTAKYDGTFKTQVEQGLAAQFQQFIHNNGAMQLVSMRQHFGSLFRRLLSDEQHQVSITIDKKFFPHYIHHTLSQLKIKAVDVLVEKDSSIDWGDFSIELTIDNFEASSLDLSSPNNTFGEHLGSFLFNALNNQHPLKDWQLTLSTEEELNLATLIKNIYLVITYDLSGN